MGLLVKKQQQISQPYPLSLWHAGELIAASICIFCSLIGAAKVSKNGFIRMAAEFCGDENK